MLPSDFAELVLLIIDAHLLQREKKYALAQMKICFNHREVVALKIEAYLSVQLQPLLTVQRTLLTASCGFKFILTAAYHGFK